MRWTLLNKIFDEKQILRLKNDLIEHDINVDQIADALLGFGNINTSNKTDAFDSIYPWILNGKQ